MANKTKHLPTVQGVGIVGNGPYTPFKRGVITKHYKLWTSMLERCFSLKYKLNNVEYMNCSLHSDWLYFQNFAAWCDQQIGFGNKGWHLDKDLLSPLKIYGPDTCVFIPAELNALLNKRTRARNSTKVKGVLLTANNRYCVNCKLGGGTVWGGTYDTIDEAFLVYKTIKEEFIKKQAEKWKNMIDIRVYECLMSHSIQQYD